jgi:hypothetical protein
MPLKTGMSLGVFDVGMQTIAETFFGYGSLPSLDAQETWIFQGSSLYQIFYIFIKIKHSHSFGEWVSGSLNTLKSSKNNFINTPR